MPDHRPPQVTQIARLHRRALPGSLLSALGQRAVEAYYGFVNGSAQEVLFVEQDAGKVLGACVLSYAPASLNRRFFVSRPLAMGWTLLAGMLASAAVRAAVAAMFREAGQPESVANWPEVVQLFTAEDARGRGIGKRLLARAEERLADGGVHGYFVRTEAASDNAAIGFYERQGFVRAASQEAGGGFLFLKRSLS